MNADLRGFEYPFDPLLKRRQWELEANLARLGKIQQEINEIQADLDILHRRYTDQCHEASIAMQRRVDPSGYLGMLSWLRNTIDQIKDLERRLAEKHAQRTEVRAQCAALQLKVDVLESHRNDAISEFALLAVSAQTKDADRDWLTRHPGTKSPTSAMITRKFGVSLGLAR